MTELDELRRRLRHFAEVEVAGESPLYAHLAACAAEDEDVAGLLLDARQQSAHGTLLLAAAHRLLYAEPFHPLSRYYPSVGGADGVDGATWPMFREFVLGRADRMRELIGSRFTQTNEVRRAALLYPAVGLAAREARGPVGLLEVGCSAGLLLDLHRYGYRYQTESAGQLVAGPTKTPVGLHCAVELAPGAELPRLPKTVKVGARVGLDRAPADLSDEDTYGWLEACIWADQPERLRLFGVAASMQRKDPPELVSGDAVDDLAAAAARVPAALPLVVFNTHTLRYLPEQRRADYVAALAALSEQRPLWWISAEAYGAGLDVVLPDRADLEPGDGEPYLGTLAVVRWSAGQPDVRVLAKTAPHGERMEWLTAT
ncbi:MAG: DUF2332 family protein [Pseudonocardiaceae bacterium]|nr:DUF2332 family protein [Pseudonocardiaceae bacterium]